MKLIYLIHILAGGLGLVTMFYWLWRVRARRSARGLVAAGAPEAAR